MDRDTLIKALRPAIPKAEVGPNISEKEAFQNLTLRPIIKFQHDLLINLFRGYLSHHKTGFYALEESAKKTLIQNRLQKDQHLKNQVKGCVFGLFTAQEMEVYGEFEASLGKRICQMVAQRLCDSLGEL